METNVPPLIIPMWLTGTNIPSVLLFLAISDHTCTGFDKLMPEHRSFPYKYLPKMGIQLGVTFGHPIPPDEIMVALHALRRVKCSSSPSGVAENSLRHSGPPSRSELCNDLRVRGWMESAIVQAGGDFLEREGAGQCAQMDKIRSEVTAIIQRAVEDLGRKVSGDTLGLPLPHQSGDHRVR
jgi:monolysocardiolipin acyltransferase